MIPPVIDLSDSLNRLDERGFAPLHYAAYHNRYDSLTLLLENKQTLPAPIAMVISPSNWAAKQGNYAIVRELIEHRALLNGQGEYGRTPLHMSVFNGRIVTTLFVLDHGADINAVAEGDYQKTPLDDAVIHGDLEMVAALTKYSQLNVNVKDIDRHTPLYYAVQEGLIEIAKLLIIHPGYKMPTDPAAPNHKSKLLKLQSRYHEGKIAALLRAL